MDSGQDSAQTKQAKKSKKWPKVLLAVVLVVSLAGNAFLVFEKLNTKQEKNMTGAVCGDDVIENYNKLYSELTTNNTNSEQNSNLIKEIEAKENYKEDINCVYISYLNGLLSGSYSSEYYNLVKKMVSEGKSPSMKIVKLYSISEMDTLNNSLSGNQQVGGYSGE